GRTVDVKVKRDSREQTLQITTEKASNDFSRLYSRLPDANLLRDRVVRSFPQVQVHTTFSKSGIQVEQMTDQLRDYFGVSGNYGVLVTSVDKNSSAEKA